jgi:hypothetical protein
MLDVRSSFLCFNREEGRGDAKLLGWSDMMNGFAAESLRHPNFRCPPLFTALKVL